MRVELAKVSDKELIDAYCIENGFHFPSTQSIYVVKDESGNIKGIAGLEALVKIEPFIADNPVVADKLYAQLLDILYEQNVDKVECFTTNQKVDKVKPLFEKLGFIFAEQTNRFIKYITIGNH